jgi:hypothetical protein
MSLSHSKTEKAAKRFQPLRLVARGNAWVIDETPYELPSPAIQSAKNSIIRGLLRNLTVSLTVKFKNKMTKTFLPSDLPSKRRASGQ